MVYVRGHACDFEEWVAAGADGWGYADCLPYFKRAETWQGGEDDYRGGSGPLGVSGGNNMAGEPLYQAFIEAGVEAGYPRTDDYNGYCQEGFGPMHMTVRGGVRESTSRAYLRPALKRRNLTVMKHVLVDKIVFDGKRAIGVAARANGKDMLLHANKEVILSAGAIASPMILQRSGIGPEAVLRDAGIAPATRWRGSGRICRTISKSISSSIANSRSA